MKTPKTLDSSNLMLNFVVITSRKRSSGNAFATEAEGSNLKRVKSDTVLPTSCHRCSISLKRAVFPSRNDAEMGPANSLHASM